jgi:hypothetical protein
MEPSSILASAAAGALLRRLIGVMAKPKPAPAPAPALPYPNDWADVLAAYHKRLEAQREVDRVMHEAQVDMMFAALRTPLSSYHFK